MSSRDPLRIGDAERSRAAQLLSEHMAEGRLTQPEFDERLSVALTAKTAAELEPLFLDLPGPNPGRPAELPQTLLEPTQWRAHELARSTGEQRVAPAVDWRWTTALTVAVAVAWAVTALIYVRTSVDTWTIFILPIVLSVMLSRLKGSRH